jgi:2-phosphosulfolactate phosphatase
MTSIDSIEVLFSPAEFAALRHRELKSSLCVVFDVLRATSSMVTALGNEAVEILPVEDIAGALEFRRQRPDALLAGERDGVRIPAALAAGTAFDLGNSPREFTRAAVGGRTIVMTTTNGTRALRACSHAGGILVGSFLNLGATADSLVEAPQTRFVLVCSGTYEEAAFEDVLCAGAMCDLLFTRFGGLPASDSALMARRLYLQARGGLAAALGQSRNGARLLANAELRGDVDFCARTDATPLAVRMDGDGRVRRVE